MPCRTTSKYTAFRSQEIAVEAFAAIQDAERALTADEIIASSPVLTGVSPQKIARELSKYVDLALIRKVKKNNRVAYAKAETYAEPT